MTYALIHELAHEREGAGAPPRPRWWWEGESLHDYQVNLLHTEKFRRLHGEILSYHLEHQADYWENLQLRRWAEEDQDYSSPIHPRGESWVSR